jgi:GPI mannosyltransferase 3
VMLRLQCGLFCVALLAILLARGQRRVALEALATLAFCAVIYGLIDRLTWGDWFHSAAAYLRFNLLEGQSAKFGKAPPAFYSRGLLYVLGPLWIAVAACALCAVRRAPGLAITVLAFYVLHAAVPHKELRFLFPALAVACALAAVGVQALSEWKERAGLAAAGVLLVASVVSAATYRRLTFHDFGIGEPNHPDAFDRGGSESRLLKIAGRQSDLCGVTVFTNDLGYTHGYAYLHKDVPLYERPGPPREERHYNYAVSTAGEEHGALVARDGDVELVRVFDGPCEPDAKFAYHLERD